MTANGARYAPGASAFTRTLTVQIPLKTVSGANVREHHMARAKRVRAERFAVGMVLNTQKVRPALPCIVMLGRLSRSWKLLDDDNLAVAMKAVRDEVASWLGADDGDERITWRYSQKCSMPEWGVAIVVGW